MPRQASITVRMPPPLKEALTEAARRLGCTVDGFLLHAALKVATETLEVPEYETAYYLKEIGWFTASNDGRLRVGPTAEQVRDAQRSQVVGTSEEVEKDSFGELLKNLDI